MDASAGRSTGSLEAARSAFYPSDVARLDLPHRNMYTLNDLPKNIVLVFDVHVQFSGEQS